ncbi:MAG: ribose 5-phosphate isomerase B [Lachnospiraceae bacterium]|nr:ribose 5-phosphate isomerase B [Lachnospiraceae bacterium]
MKIVIGNDHAAVEMKNEIKAYLESKGIEVLNVGTDTSESVNYPEYGEKVGRAVVGGEADRGIAICGTGVGISIACNKVRGVRAVCCSEPYSAKLSRMHNDSNVLCFGARVIGPELAKMIVDEWIATEFEGGRHKKRVDMISAIEARN